MSNKEKIGWTEDDVTDAKKNRRAVKKFHETWFSGQQKKSEEKGADEKKGSEDSKKKVQ